MKNFITFLAGVLIFCFLCTTMAFPQTKAQTQKAEILLDHIIGAWNMSGQVENKAVKYSFEAKRILHDKLVLMHMEDLAVPSPYEADVYIGYDTSRACYVTFWLDNFGVDSAVTVFGYGKAHRDTLVILFNFPNEPFRDTFTYDSINDAWRFLLEDGNPQGTWTTFADYKLTRKTH